MPAPSAWRPAASPSRCSAAGSTGDAASCSASRSWRCRRRCWPPCRRSRSSPACASCKALCMSTAFALTLAYLGEHTSAGDTASAFAAYVTGNVASNLFGRLLAAGVVDHLGLAANFHVFAALNLAGAVLVWFTVERTPPMRADRHERRPAVHELACSPRQPGAARGLRHRLPDPVRLHRHLHLRELRAGPTALLGRHDDAGGRSISCSCRRWSPRRWPAASWRASAPGRRSGPRSGSPLAGLPLLLSASLAAVLAGLALVAVGTFFAQATATGFVGRAATTDRGVGERPLPRQLLSRRPRRQRRAGTALRPPRLDGLRRRDRRVAGAGHAAGLPARDSCRPSTRCPNGISADPRRSR